LLRCKNLSATRAAGARTTHGVAHTSASTTERCQRLHRPQCSRRSRSCRFAPKHHSAVAFRNLRGIADRDTSELIATSTRKPFPEAHIRPYVLCETPAFLTEETFADLSEILPEEIAATEGERRQKLVHSLSRERRLRAAKIRLALRTNPNLFCEVPGCGFSFSKTYGALGREYAIIHHIQGLASREGPARTDLFARNTQSSARRRT
jgi:hypothetical protein